MAIWDSIIGNDFVVSPGENVTIRISANPMRASQGTQEESKGESTVNFVIIKQRKVFDTLWPKWQVDCKQWSCVIALLLIVRPENSGLLKVPMKSVNQDMVNPINPVLIRKDRAEDARKSECHSVME